MKTVGCNLMSPAIYMPGFLLGSYDVCFPSSHIDWNKGYILSLLYKLWSWTSWFCR